MSDLIFVKSSPGRSHLSELAGHVAAALVATAGIQHLMNDQPDRVRELLGELDADALNRVSTAATWLAELADEADTKLVNWCTRCGRAPRVEGYTVCEPCVGLSALEATGA